MTKLLKISALAVMLFGITTPSQMALACYPNCKTHGENMNELHHIMEMQEQERQRYQTAPTISYYADYNSMWWTAENKPYFYSHRYHPSGPTSPEIIYEWGERDAEKKCNNSSKRAPCQFAQQTISSTCVAYIPYTPESGLTLLHSGAGYTCKEAKQSAKQSCLETEKNNSVCDAVEIKTKKF